MDKKNICNIYELSPIQLGILFETIYVDSDYENKDKYFIQSIYEVNGKLDGSAWQKAWEIVVDRNESLRAGFIWEKLNEPLQVIYRKVEIIWQEYSWQGYETHIIKEKLEKLAESERNTGFELNKPVLMRFNLIKVSDNQHYFIWNKHHIILDGWSLSIILDEVNRIYHFLISGKELDLVLRKSYKEYILWLKSCNQSDAKLYWSGALKGCIQTKIGGSAGDKDGEYKFKLDKICSQQIRELAQSLGVTTSIIVQAIWSIVLSKFTLQKDVVFGVTISGRQIDLPDVENIVGIFINTIPLRVQFLAHNTFKMFVEAIKDAMGLGQNYGYISLASIQANYQLGGDGLFDNILVYENYPLVEGVGFDNGLSIKYLSSHERTGYALTVTVIPGEELEFRFSYRGRFLSAKQINLLARTVVQVAKTIVNCDHDSYLGEVITISNKELKQIIGWNETDKQFDSSSTLNAIAFLLSVITNFHEA